jgi:hypothetical protein
VRVVGGNGDGHERPREERASVDPVERDRAAAAHEIVDVRGDEAIDVTDHARRIRECDGENRGRR